MMFKLESICDADFKQTNSMRYHFIAFANRWAPSFYYALESGYYINVDRYTRPHTTCISIWLFDAVYSIQFVAIKDGFSVPSSHFDSSF